MSIFNDKINRSIAEAAAKILEGTHPKTDKEKDLAALAHPKDKITHKDVLVGRGVLKKEETEQLDELSKETLKSYVDKASDGGMKQFLRKHQIKKAEAKIAMKEESCEDEAEEAVDKHEKRMHGKKGEVKKHEKEMHKEDVMPFSSLIESYRKKGLKSLSQMQEGSYTGKNPHHIKSVGSSGQGAIVITTNAGAKHNLTAKDTGGKMPKIGEHINKYVKEEVEQIDEISSELARKVSSARFKNVMADPQNQSLHDKSERASNSTLKRLQRDMIRDPEKTNRGYVSDAEKNTKRGWSNESVEQIDELDKSTLGSYIKKSSHDVAAKGAATRQFANDSEAARKDQNYVDARKSMQKADKTFAKSWKRREGMAKAVDRLTKEEVQLEESITHIIAKNDLEKHKDWMDSEGYHTETKPLPASHPKSKTHVGIVAGKDVIAHSYHEQGYARPIKEGFEQLDVMKKYKAESVDESKMKGDDPCWDTHEMVGHKMKGGKKVPNCVPKNEEVDSETYKKEMEDQKAKFDGKKKGADVAKASVQSVKQEEVGRMDEGDAYDKDRYSVKDGKATKDNPSHMGSANYKDQPHHVWATSPQEALKKKVKEEVELEERTLTGPETKKKEEVVKSMKKNLQGFKDRYGDRAKSVMYATATKTAKEKA
jgi:hypothetical protein